MRTGNRLCGNQTSAISLCCISNSRDSDWEQKHCNKSLALAVIYVQCGYADPANRMATFINFVLKFRPKADIRKKGILTSASLARLPVVEVFNGTFHLTLQKGSG
jgi:hypothetical protein